MASFENREYLLLLLLLPLLALLFIGLVRWKAEVVRRIGDESLVRSMVRGSSPRRSRLRFLLFSLAFAFCIAALANLRSSRSVEAVRTKGVDVLLALDVSRSMYADDVRPSRLLLAKQMLSRAMGGLPGARIGLILFAGRSYLQMPLTFDHQSASSYLSAAVPESVPSQGTAIAEALAMAVNALSADERTQKVLLMVTDGEDHEEGMADAVRAVRESGIRLMVAGVGTAAGVTLRNPETGLTRLDAQGRPVVTRLNEAFLRDLAGQAGGVYLGSSKADPIVDGFLAKVDALEKSNLPMPSDGSRASHYQWFIAAALALLLLETLLRETPKMAA